MKKSDFCLLGVVALLVCWQAGFCVAKVTHRKVHFDEHRIISLTKPNVANTLSRFRRSLAPNEPPKAEDNERLDVKVTPLKDANHNEAIVHWSGKNSNVMFVLTREHYANGSVPDSKLWRSSDYGATFREMSVPQDALIRYYYSCPTNKSKLLFTDSRNKKIYSTIDEGTTPLKVASAINFTPDKLLFHPTRQEWVLAYTFTEKMLYVSTDMGSSWDKIDEFVNSRFYWALPGVDQDDSAIHYEKLDPLTGQYSFFTVQYPYPTPVVLDPQLGFIDMDSLVIADNYIFVQKSTPFTTTLLVSYKRGPFKTAYFPFDVHPKDFSIVNTDEEQVFLAADHREKTVHLYLSDQTGQFFIKTLDNIVALRQSGSGFDADLYEVHGVKGTYIANQYTQDNPQTLITFDKGGKWRHIKAPAVDASNAPTNCEPPKCALHLHLGYSQAMNSIPFILSEENAPGLIIAQGHLGPDLAPDQGTRSSLFISRDGGLSWKMVFEGEYSYNILDQGGVIVAVPNSHNSKTKYIYYSCTEGAEWKRYNFSQSDLQIDGVLNEPGITTLVVSIYGHLNKDSGWVIVMINFTSVLMKQCGDDDYETWTPSDDIKNHNCILGETLTYKRRKQMSQCHNGRDYEKAISSKPCKCIREDYECDFGYEHQLNDYCTRASWFDPSQPVAECPEGSYYNKSVGYRKIAADKCEGETSENYQPKRAPCPLMKPDQLHILANIRHPTVATGTTLKFTLLQGKGSKNSTKYTWSLNDLTHTSVTVTGYENAREWNHTFTKCGFYTITMTAANTVGTTQTSSDIRVEDAIQGLLVDLPHAAEVAFPVYFQASSVVHNTSNSNNGYIHYLWMFGDEGLDEKPMLTYATEVTHIYQLAGNYTVTVEAINSVGSAYKIITTPVYGTMKTVQLSFNRELDHLNDNSEMWSRTFAGIVKKTLMWILGVEHTRLEVATLRGLPTTVDVSILPVRQDITHDDTIDEIVQTLVKKVSGGSVAIPMDEWGQTGQNITITSLSILKDKGAVSHTVSHNYIAIFLGVPILLLAIFISVRIGLYYRKRWTTVRRYSILQSHANEEDDCLLGEDDDDDLPLDPDPDFTQREALEADITSRDFGFPGMQPALVMMTGTNDDSNNSINC